MELVNQRLYNQQLSNQMFTNAGDVVRHLGAVQAQDYLASLWAIALRLDTASESDIEKEISRGTIIRTWPMRGTLHYVAPEDIRWMLKLLTPGVIARSAGRYRQLELDDATFAQSRSLLEKALEGGKQLTRPEVYQILAEKNISAANSRGLHILAHLAQQGVICFGPRRDKQATFTLLDEWVPKGRSFVKEEALAEITMRYFCSHGPATLHDFAWWSGLKISDVKSGLAIIDSQLHKEIFDGKTFFAPLRSDIPVRPTGAHLLPSFDEYTVAYKYRDVIIDPKYFKRMNAGGGILKPVMVIDGRVKGIWKRVLKKKAVTMTFASFKTLDDRQRSAFMAAAQRYGRFLGKTVEVIVEDQDGP